VVDCGVAAFVRPGQSASGDCHLVCSNSNGILIAAIDGIGHGNEAANAARAATAILAAGQDEPVISLVERCHEELKLTRGVVMSLAFVDARHGMMTWLGVGNVQGVLTRARAKNGMVQETLLLRGGVVGAQLPPLQAAVLPVEREDTVIFATDGVRPDFVESLSPLEGPQRAADRILERYWNGSDDALVLVARLTGIGP
jgi:phosphoserine phosphatase RsbX